MRSKLLLATVLCLAIVFALAVAPAGAVTKKTVTIYEYGFGGQPPEKEWATGPAWQTWHTRSNGFYFAEICPEEPLMNGLWVAALDDNTHLVGFALYTGPFQGTGTFTVGTWDGLPDESWYIMDADDVVAEHFTASPSGSLWTGRFTGSWTTGMVKTVGKGVGGDVRGLQWKGDVVLGYTPVYDLWTATLMDPSGRILTP
jgi:hypothetical protein